MTLYKQIMLVLSILALLLLSTAMFINYKNAEGFVKDQLFSNAENTASTLGVAIGNVQGDKAMAETFINAVFDSGYYESIIFSDMEGNVVYQKRLSVEVQDVPSWFIDYVHLSSSEASVPLSSNWRMIGTLKVKGHLGHAYEQLWHAFKEMIMGFVILGTLALLGMYILLKIVLSPLKRVREQAEAVIRREFIFQEELPKTKEMRDIVTAMNVLVMKVKKVYEQETKAIADYNRLLYEDKETGYYNRDYFRIKLQAYLHANDYFSHGHILAFEIHNYTKLLEQDGVNGMHKAIVQLRDTINAHFDKFFSESILCRTRANDIMIIVPSSRLEEIEKLATAVCSDSKEHYPINCAYISYEEGEKLSGVLEKVDHALMTAEAMEGVDMRIYADGKSDIPILSHDEWKKRVIDVLENDAFIPMFQAVKNVDSQIVQNELLLRLQYEDKRVSAGVFMPIIAGVNMLSELDQYVLKLLSRLQPSKPLSVNLTHDFISDSGNLHLISSLSSEWKAQGVDIIFELTNATIALDPEASKAFASHIHREGWKLTIDHFIVGTYDLHLLETLKPDYLKINAGYLLGLVEGGKDNASNSSLFTLTELLDIEIIAISVDSAETAERLNNHDIKLMQGFWIEKPNEEMKNDK